jgi:hypothetical protein
MLTSGSRRKDGAAIERRLNMIVSRRTWAIGAIALAVGGCGGSVSATATDGGTTATDGGADATAVPGDAGTDTGTTTDCVDGGISFAFTIEAGAPVCPGSAFGCSAFSDWLTVTGPGGSPVQMGNPFCTDCNSCTVGCPPGPCEPPQPTT